MNIKLKILFIILCFCLIAPTVANPKWKYIKFFKLYSNEGHKHFVITKEGIYTCWLCNTKGIRKYIRKSIR